MTGKKNKNAICKFLNKLGIKNTGNEILEDNLLFSITVKTIISEICDLYKLTDTLATVKVVEEIDEFFFELSDFLREYGCPYTHILEGPMADRFGSVANKTLLLQFLCGELAAARKLQKTQTNQMSSASVNLSPASSAELTEHLRKACLALKMPKPPANIQMAKLMDSLSKAVTMKLSSCPPNYLGNSIIPKTGLSDSNWSEVCKIASLLQHEYNNRRKTFIKRVDCTIQSFKWSEKGKSQVEKISSIYNPLRAAMNSTQSIDVAHILAARDNVILCIDKTSDASSCDYSESPLSKILMGSVPDRGGRAWEIDPPPPEMPNFQKRQPGPVGRGGGDRGFEHHHRGRGGREQFSSRGRGSDQRQVHLQHKASSFDFANAPTTGIGFSDNSMNYQNQNFTFQPEFFAHNRGGGGRGRGFSRSNARPF